MTTRAWFEYAFNPEKDSMGSQITDFMASELEGDWFIAMNPKTYHEWLRANPSFYSAVDAVRIPKAQPLGVDINASAELDKIMETTPVRYYDVPIRRCTLIPDNTIWFVTVETLSTLVDLANRYIDKRNKEQHFEMIDTHVCPTCNQTINWSQAYKR